MAEPAGKQRTTVDANLAARMAQACDLHDRIPPMNHGRLSHIQDELKRQHGMKVSRETVRKWLAGEARPRPDKMKVLAELLRVDEAWLSLGLAPDMPPQEKRARPAAVSGAVTYVAGIVAMGGGTVAFPEKDDPQGSHIHFHAILDGRQRAFYVSLAAAASKGQLKFVVPVEFERKVIVGVVNRSYVDHVLYRLDPELISKFGNRRGGYIELLMQEQGRNLVKEGFSANPVTEPEDWG